MENLEKKELERKKKRTYPKDFDLNNELYTLSCKKEKIILTGDPEEDMKKIQTINSEDKKNRLNIMDKNNYSLISYITSTKRPDLYHRYCFTSGEDYSIKLLKDQNEKIENSKNENEENEYSDSNKSSENYSTMKNKSIRYFTFNTNITYKCYNCGEVGHMSGNCPYENIIYCLKCNKKGHEEKDCPYTKCFKCNQFGHKSFQCPFKIDKLKICTRCFSIGHKNEDCLKNPIYPSENYYSFNNVQCLFCGSNKHLICPFSVEKSFDFKDGDNFDKFKKSDVEKWEENRKKNGKDGGNKDGNNSEEEGEIINERNYFEDLDDSKISSCIFCPICAGRHTINNCEEYELNQEKYKNKFDEQRENYVKNLLSKNRDTRDNYNRNKEYNNNRQYNNKDNNNYRKYNNKDYNSNRDNNDNNNRDYNNKDYNISYTNNNNNKYYRDRSRDKDYNNNMKNKDFKNRNNDFNDRNKDFNRNKNNFNDNNGRREFDSKFNKNIKGFGRGYYHEKKYRNNNNNSKGNYYN